MLFRNFIFLTVVVSIVDSDWDNQELSADKIIEDKESKFRLFVNTSDNNKQNLLKFLTGDDNIFLPSLSKHSLKSYNRYNYVFRTKRSQHLLNSSTGDNYIFWPSLLEHAQESSNKDEYISRLIPSQHLPKSSTRDNYIFLHSLSDHSLQSSNRDKHVSWPKTSQYLLQSSTKDNTLNILPRLSPNLFKIFNRYNCFWLKPWKIHKECECGKSAVLKTNRLIIAGKPIEHMESYPFVVSLHRSGIMGGGWGFCGGAIISPTFVMTAAHCVVKKSFQNCSYLKNPPLKCRKKPSEIEVGILGKSKYRPAYKVPVKRIIINPNYQLKDSLYDLALIELKKPIPCTDYSRPICLTSKVLAKPGEIINLVGSGGTMMGTGGMSDEFHHGITYTIKTSICPIRKRAPSIICTQGVKYGACHGDSGTSAFVDYQGRYYSVGLTSEHTSTECNPQSPVVYTRISYFYYFITKHVKNLPKPKEIYNPHYKTEIIGF